MTLAIFPHGLEATLLIPVLVGVLVNAACTETLGWDFVGLVVPGYLCAVVMLQPTVAAMVVIEASLTWAVARGLDAGATRAGLIYPVFGRDRFYLILVVSVVVRAGVEGLLLGPLVAGLRRFFPALGPLEPDLFGIGLVLVPLMANRFWRPGWRSGVWQLGVETAIVRLIVFGLQHLTNFSVAGFALSFDRVALGFFDAPGGQLVLISTAALASRFSRRFGWDSHGILVPALLGLVVVAPLKLAATMAEAMLIVGGAQVIIRLPRVRLLNLEGPRKLVLCLLVGVGLRALLLASLGMRYPGYRAADLFGFGYLLPGLLAERVLAKGRPITVVLASVQTAVVGVPLAAALALALTWIAPGTPADRAERPIERYRSLPQAIAAHAHAGAPAHTETLANTVDRLMRGDADAVSGDGYNITRTARGWLLARPIGGPQATAKVLVSSPEDGHAERAAEEAVRLGAALVVGADDSARPVAARLGDVVVPFAGNVLARPADVPTLAQPARALMLPPRSSEVAAAVLPTLEPRALWEVALRIKVDHQNPERLAASLHPLGLVVRLSADGAIVITGDGWPRLLLRRATQPLPAIAMGTEAGAPIVLAPHHRELGADAAAAFAADVLAGDCVIASDGDDDQAATTLAIEWAALTARPLLVIRGTDDGEALHGDALLLANPVPTADDWPEWLAPLQRATGGWLTPADPTLPAAAAYRRFPAGSGRLRATALLWLDRRARRALAGDTTLGQDDVLALTQAGGIAVVHGDIVDWLLAGRGAPPSDAIAAAERLARTGDPAMLGRHDGGARGPVMVDIGRGLLGIGVADANRRAVIIAGDRREGRIAVGSRGDALRALEQGARTLLGS